MGLGYPGGPLIDKLSRKGNKEAIAFPRVYLENDSLDFSFSGLKSAVLNYLNSCKMKEIEIIESDVAASFQQAVIDVLVDKTISAAKKWGVKTIVIAGGVAANSGLRELLDRRAKESGFELRVPSISLCTDNAAMIGCAAYYDYLKGYTADMHLNAVANLRLGERYRRVEA